MAALEAHGSALMGLEEQSWDRLEAGKAREVQMLVMG